MADMVLPAVTVERRLTFDEQPYVLVTRSGGLKGDEVTVFHGPNAEVRALAYARWKYQFTRGK
jgi:hypothetical protein